MLRSMNELQGFRLHATDGDIGEVVEVFFDDRKGTVRYVVINTGGWTAHRVLISPTSVTHIDWTARAVNVSLTKSQIHASPDPDLHPPVSRQFEHNYSLYYGYAPYWIGTNYWGSSRSPAGLERQSPIQSPSHDPGAGSDPAWDAHLRSSRDVRGHHIHASDGEIGHVDDFLVDDESWAIRYLQVDTSNWFGGKAVLIPQKSVQTVSWPDKAIHVDMSRDQILQSPAYDPARLNRQLEQRIDEHHGV